MADRVMTYIKAGGPRDDTSPPDDDTPIIPLNPKEEDYQQTFWHQSSWNTFKNEADPADFDSKNPLIAHFMEDVNGNPISPGLKSAIRGELFAYWTDVRNKGETPANFTETGLARKEDFRKTFEAKYPWLRLCEGHWKVDQLWINYLKIWRRSRITTPEAVHPKSATTPDAAYREFDPKTPTGMSPVEGTNNTAVPVGLKRSFEGPVDVPSKRQKGKLFEAIEPTNFHHGRPRIAKKITAKIAKVRPLFPPFT